MFRNQKIETYIKNQKVYENSIRVIKKSLHRSERQSTISTRRELGVIKKKDVSGNYILYAKCLIDQLHEQIEIKTVQTE